MFARLLGHRPPGEDGDNTSAGWSLLGQRGRLARVSDRDIPVLTPPPFKGSNSPVVSETHHHLAARRETQRLQGCWGVWGGQAALQPSPPSGLAACVLVRLGQLNWRLLLMLNIAGCNNDTSSIYAGLCTWCVCVSPPATPASTITAQLAETRGAAISSSLGHEPTFAGARKTSMPSGFLFLILYVCGSATRTGETRLNLSWERRVC